MTTGQQQTHRNAALIYNEGVRTVSGRIPAQVRKELNEAVKLGYIGHLKKRHLVSEVFFRPDLKQVAARAQEDQFARAVGALKAVFA